MPKRPRSRDAASSSRASRDAASSSVRAMPKRPRSAGKRPRRGRGSGVRGEAERHIPHLPVAVQPLNADDLTFMCCLVGVGAPHFVCWLWYKVLRMLPNSMRHTHDHLEFFAGQMAAVPKSELRDIRNPFCFFAFPTLNLQTDWVFICFSRDPPKINGLRADVDVAYEFL